MSARTEPHPALSHRCPFCHADPGQSCRTNRGRGRELDRLHSRRIALATPVAERRLPTRVNALCCVCGNLRTVSADYSRWQHPDHPYSAQGKAEGWRKTEPLKCDACGQSTRHAVLLPDDGRFRDWDERQQLIALGDDDTGKYRMSEDAIERLRREYRELYPRNPYLRHRYWVKDAKQAWADGRKKVTALCGEPMDLKCDPNRPSTKKEEPGQIVADKLSDTEYEDPDTGLWWIDMSCVDCCRVSNNHHRANQRKLLEQWLIWLLARPERVSDQHVDTLIDAFNAAVWTPNGKGAGR